jgi:hypothetical protein
MSYWKLGRLQAAKRKLQEALGFDELRDESTAALAQIDNESGLSSP